MHIRAACLASIVVAAALVPAAQQLPESAASARRKQRIHDIPTPGHLGGLRIEAAPLLEIDTQGAAVDLPQVWAVDPATGSEFRRGELLVRFKDSVDSISRAQALRSSGGGHIAQSLAANWSLVQLDSGTLEVDASAALAKNADVAEVSLNYRVETQQVRPNDEFYRLQWNFDAINMPAAWQINPGARDDVIVAVVDTGLNVVTDTFLFSSPYVGQVPVRFAAVPDLVSDGRIVAPYDFIWGDRFPLDLGGHGTHVAGTIAQQTNNNAGVAGVAYNVRLMPLKVLSGGGGIVSWDDVFLPGNRGGTAETISQAVRYAADNGAHVINMSLGGTGSLPTVRDAISYAVGRGSFVTISAGNSRDDGNPVMYPAAYAADINGAMAVGAVNRDLTRADYSEVHPYVEVCAPGGDAANYDRGITQVGYEEAFTLSYLTPVQKILALYYGFRPRFDRFELRPLKGTSMAAPHVAGVAALLHSQGIRNPAAIEEAIKRFARPINASSNECGAGLLDPRRALRGLGLAR